MFFFLVKNVKKIRQKKNVKINKLFLLLFQIYFTLDLKFDLRQMFESIMIKL